LTKNLSLRFEYGFAYIDQTSGAGPVHIFQTRLALRF
jgi:hypothetical protein